MRFKPFDEQVVVVFGASSGIGRLTAKRFAKEGARVVVAARDQVGLESLVQEIEAEGGTALAQKADTANYEEVRQVGERAITEFGSVDTWVHAAAVTLYSLFRETTPDELRQVFEVNLIGHGYGAHVGVDCLLRSGGGALIHISSIEAMMGTPYTSVYAASKHGIRGLLDVIRMEVRHERLPISVTNIMPAGINTPLFSHARTKLGVKPMPIPPIYDPNLVADAILYSARHRVAEIMVGGSGKVCEFFKRLCPRLLDRVIGMIGFKGQRTQAPKSVAAANNLFQPFNDGREHGDFSNVAHGRSYQVWMATHPLAKMALWAGVGMLALTWWKRR